MSDDGVIVKFKVGSRTEEIKFDSKESYLKSFLLSKNGRFSVRTPMGVRPVHCLDGPAIKYADGSEEWLVRGIAHRADAPAVVSLDSDGSIWQEQWYEKGKLHRHNGPAFTVKIKEETSGGTQTFFIRRWYSRGVFRKEVITDANGNFVSKRIATKGKSSAITDGAKQERQDMMIKTGDLEPKRGTITNLDHEPVELLSSKEVENSGNLIQIWVLDANGNPATIACSPNYFYKDIIQEGSCWFLDGTKYTTESSPNFHDKLRIHRGNDKPAIIYPDGRKEWLVNGLLHRVNGPAIEGADGLRQWWHGGILHRDDGPAEIDSSGNVFYWLNGVRVSATEVEEKQKKGERPAAAISVSDVKVRVKLKGVKEPLTLDLDEYENSCCLMPDGKYKIKFGHVIDSFLHSEDGPAVEYSDGRHVYCLNGVVVSKEEVQRAPKASLNSNAQILINATNHDPIYASSSDSLWKEVLSRDQIDGRIRFRDTGEIVSNKTHPAIFYRDGTKLCVVNGKSVDPSLLLVQEGNKYCVESIRDWKVDGKKITINKAETVLEWWKAEPCWTVKMEGEGFGYKVELPFSAINETYEGLHSIVKETGLSHREAFQTAVFADEIINVVLANGPQFMKKQPLVKDSHKAAIEKSIDMSGANSPSTSSDLGFGLPLACLVLAGLTKAMTTNKKSKVAEKKNIRQQEIPAVSKEVVMNAVPAVKYK